MNDTNNTSIAVNKAIDILSDAFSGMSESIPKIWDSFCKWHSINASSELIITLVLLSLGILIFIVFGVLALKECNREAYAKAIVKELKNTANTCRECEAQIRNIVGYDIDKSIEKNSYLRGMFLAGMSTGLVIILFGLGHLPEELANAAHPDKAAAVEVIERVNICLQK